MTPVERIIAAIELNPDRKRVTLCRDNVRSILADNQRLSADAEHYKTAAIRLEAMCTAHLGRIERQTTEIAEISADRDRAAQAAEHLRQAKPQLPTIVEIVTPRLYDRLMVTPIRVAAVLAGFGLSGALGFFAHG